MVALSQISTKRSRACRANSEQFASRLSEPMASAGGLFLCYTLAHEHRKSIKHRTEEIALAQDEEEVANKSCNARRPRSAHKRQRPEEVVPYPIPKPTGSRTIYVSRFVKGSLTPIPHQFLAKKNSPPLWLRIERVSLPYEYGKNQQRRCFRRRSRERKVP